MDILREQKPLREKKAKKEPFVLVSVAERDQKMSEQKRLSKLERDMDTKSKSALLVFGYVRKETAVYRIYFPKGIVLLCLKWYHLKFVWDENNAGKLYSLDSNKILLNSDNLTPIGAFEHKYHTAFLQAPISTFEKYTFEFVLKGTLKSRHVEMAVGVADDKYATPRIQHMAGIGDCSHSASFYLATFTDMYFNGKHVKPNLQETISPNGTHFKFIVQNKKGNKCDMELWHENYANGHLAFTAPMNAVKVGVSMGLSRVTNPVTLGLELVNVSVE